MPPPDSETSDDDASETDQSLASHQQDLTTARPLPGRTFMGGPGQQFSVFDTEGRGMGDKSFEDYASRASTGTERSATQEESSNMRRVTASLLEILTQVAAVSKDGAWWNNGARGGAVDPLRWHAARRGKLVLTLPVAAIAEPDLSKGGKDLDGLDTVYDNSSASSGALAAPSLERPATRY